MKGRRHPTQLELPGTLLETVSLQEDLERATAYIQEQRAECDELRRQLAESQAQYRGANAKLTKFHQMGMGGLLEAKSKIRMLEMLCDSLKLLLLEKAQTAPPVDQPWLLKELTRLLTICHPDKWQGSPVAEELTKQVLVVRQRLQGKTSGMKAGTP
jgi:hypothetical protein